MASHPSFQAADVHTGFIDQHFDSLFPKRDVDERSLVQAVVAAIVNEQNAEKFNALERNSNANPFDECQSFRINTNAIRRMVLISNGKGKTC